MSARWPVLEPPSPLDDPLIVPQARLTVDSEVPIETSPPPCPPPRPVEPSGDVPAVPPEVFDAPSPARSPWGYHDAPQLSEVRRSAHLERGHRGAAVRYIQELLNLVLPGLRPLRTDGLFGPRTEATVQAFQGHLGFLPSGKVQPNLLLRLQREAIRHFESLLEDSLDSKR